MVIPSTSNWLFFDNMTTLQAVIGLILAIINFELHANPPRPMIRTSIVALIDINPTPSNGWLPRFIKTLLNWEYIPHMVFVNASAFVESRLVHEFEIQLLAGNIVSEFLEINSVFHFFVI